MLELIWDNDIESYNDFCARVMSNFKDYGFEDERACLLKLTDVDMKDNSRKYKYANYNIQKAVDDGYAERFARIKNKKTNIGSRVLVIGDIHTPFEHSGYLDFCKRMYRKYKCNTVVFIGDILDSHYSSYHESSPDGFGGEEELLRAKKSIADYHKSFPNSLVCMGNHDLIPNRKAFSGGLSNRWVRSIGEVLETPTWKYAESFIIDGVKYIHGTGRKARQRCQQDMVSTVQGHYHAESYIENFVGLNNSRIFAMQIGCGIDIDSYAFAYGKHFAKPHINVGIVIDGKLPIIEFME